MKISTRLLQVVSSLFQTDLLTVDLADLEIFACVVGQVGQVVSVARIHLVGRNLNDFALIISTKITIFIPGPEVVFFLHYGPKIHIYKSNLNL